MQPGRWMRSALLALLLCELLCTLPWPWAGPAQHQQQHRHHDQRAAPPPTIAGQDDGAAAVGSAQQDAAAPAAVQYHSNLLLQRCHAAMAYNRSRGEYETPPLALWRSVGGTLASDPASAWAALQEFVLSARQPWAMYWGFLFTPPGWRVIPEHTAQDLALIQAGVPVLRHDPVYAAGLDYDSVTVIDASSSSSSSPFGAPPHTQQQGWLARTFMTSMLPIVPRWHAMCTAAVDGDTLQPAPTATCTVFARANASAVVGTFAVVPDAPPTAAAAADGSCRSTSDRPRALNPCQALGPGFLLLPALRALHNTALQWRPTALLARSAVRLWRVVVPSGSLAPLCPLASNMQLLAAEFPLKALLLYAVALSSLVRNWLYLITVAYKIQRRLAIVAAAPLPQRASGTALTLLGMALGLWQALVYAALDLAFDVALAKVVAGGLAHSRLLANAGWRASVSCGLFEVRVVTKAWRLARLAAHEARTLVMAPQALLRQAAELDKAVRRSVPTIGTWPAPLDIPDEVDELPVAEVPRGFICPITQAIMRQPALLLHDGTIAPSTYDKAAIAEWLATHSSDPKNPGVQLAMKSVKLVYNGDLGRAIEDWVGARVAASRRAAQADEAAATQQADQAQQALSLASLQAWLSGQLEAVAHQQQQQHPGGAPCGSGAVSAAAAAAGLLMQQARSHHQHQQQQQRHGGTTVAVAAAAAAAAAAPPAREAGRGDGEQPARGRRRPPAPAAPAASGSILSDAGALVRTSSAALVQVASLDLPAVAAAGLTQLASNTRRRVTRAAARRRGAGGAGEQPDAAGSDDEAVQQQQHQQRRPRQQQQAGPDDDDGTQDSGDADSSDEVSSRQRGDAIAGSSRPRRRGHAQQQQHRGSGGSVQQQRSNSVPPAAGGEADPADEPGGGGGSSGRQLRRRTPPRAAAAGARGAWS